MESQSSEPTNLTEQRLQKIAESPRDIIFILSAEGVVLYLNSGFESITGWRCQEWVGKLLQPLIDPLDLTSLEKEFKEVLQGATIPSVTIRLIKKNGERAILDGILLPEWHEGKVCQVMGMARDITEKIKTEEKRILLAHEEGLLKETQAACERALFLSYASATLFSSLEQNCKPSLIAELAVKGLADWSLVLLRNPQTGLLEAASAAVNAEQATWAQQIQSSLLPQPPLLHPFNQILETGQPKFLKKIPLSYINILTDHPEQRLLLIKLGFHSAMGVPIRLKGRTIGAILFVSGNQARLFNDKDLETAIEFGLRVGIMIENTQLYRETLKAKQNLKINDREKYEADQIRSREEAIRSSQFKTEFVANLSHEIRTPINAIVGMNGLLAMSSLTLQQQNYLETIRISSDALLSIINDILDLSKIGSGKMELEISEFKPRQLVESVVDLLAPRAAAKGLEMVADIDPSLPPLVKGDAGRLRQVLLNFGSNAVKFCERGEVVFSVEKKSESGSELMVEFSIRDSGVGINKDKLSEIFEPTSQVDFSLPRKYDGSGLGLTISKMFVELMHGTIQVQSAPGSGSVFSCRVPFGKVSSKTDGIIPGKGRLSTLRILVADDNKTARQTMVRQLTAWGVHHIIEAGNANETFSHLKETLRTKRPFDLIFLDKTIIKEPPFVVIKDILKTAPNSKSRVYVLSPLRRSPNEKFLENWGTVGHLLKPIKSSALLLSLLGEDRRASKRGPPQLPKSKPSPDKKSTVLVVEDNSINQQVVLWQLKELGYQADAVGNGVEALEALNRFPYNMVLMDCQMPEMDGFDATTRIRKNEREGTHTPIIAMTAHASKGMRDRCLAVGMNDCLIKPVTTEDLSSLLIKWRPTDGEKKFTISRSLDKTPFREEMFNLFLKVTPPNIDGLDEASQKNEWTAIRREAHRLRGSCATMGFENMVHLAGKIEKMSVEKKRGELRSLVKELRQEYEAVENWIRESLQKAEIQH